MSIYINACLIFDKSMIKGPSFSLSFKISCSLSLFNFSLVDENNRIIYSSLGRLCNQYLIRIKPQFNCDEADVQTDHRVSRN